MRLFYFIFYYFEFYSFFFSLRFVSVCFFLLLLMYFFYSQTDPFMLSFHLRFLTVEKDGKTNKMLSYLSKIVDYGNCGGFFLCWVFFSFGSIKWDVSFCLNTISISFFSITNEFSMFDNKPIRWLPKRSDNCKHQGMNVFSKEYTIILYTVKNKEVLRRKFTNISKKILQWKSGKCVVQNGIRNKIFK